MAAAALPVELPLPSLTMPICALIAALAALGYLLSRYRSGVARFTAIDALIAVATAAIVGAAAVPVIEAASRNAKETALLDNLHTLRAQIELYKLQHEGRLPAVVEGSFSQLLRATNAQGIAGPAGGSYPFGPYLRSGVPVNPFTGRSIVTATGVFPPEQPSGNGGWLYHPETGQIAADEAGYLAR